MNDGNEFDLTRRKALLGLGTIGVASAGATVGTSAYFSDQELFEGNSLEAGELDLSVHYEFFADQDGVEGENFGEPTSGTVQGGTDEETGEPVSYSLEDVKPGDSGGMGFCFSLVDNPAYLWACGELTANDETGYADPEPDSADDGDVNDPEDEDGEGELADAIEASLYYYEGDYEEGSEGDEIAYGSLREVLTQLQSGVALDGDGDGEAGVEGRAPFDSGESSDEPTDETCVYLYWEVPTDVGNEIQTDSVEMDMLFYAEQARHNDGATNPCVDDTVVTQYDNEWKDSSIANPTDGEVHTSVSYGDEQVVLRFRFVDDGDGVDFLDTGDYSSTNLPVAIDADADGTHDWQLIWNPSAGLPDDPFGYQENTGGSYSASEPLPSGFSAAKVGNTIVFGIPRDEISSTFRLLAYGSTGGEGPIAKVNADPAVGPDFDDSSDAVEFSE